MKNQLHTVPSLSGTFGIRMMLTRNPKIPKEPSSPPRSIAQTEKRCSKIETFELIEENSQHITLKHRFRPKPNMCLLLN